MQGYSPNHKTGLIVLMLFIAFFTVAPFSHALDQYPGDTAIYGVSTSTIQPNVLIILDDSGSMNDVVASGVSYSPATVYPSLNKCDGTSPCLSNKVYKWRSVDSTWLSYIADVNTITCATAKTRLTTTGVFNGRLTSAGACTSSSGSYAIGNYINWQSAFGPRPKIDIAKEVLGNLVNSTNGVKFGVMVFNTDEGGHILGMGDAWGYLGYQAAVKDMDTIFTGTTTNRTALLNSVNNVVAGTWTPLAETLFEAMRYYKGDATAFPLINGNITYTSPIEYSCQKNYVIIITDGMSTMDQNAILRTICNNGDCDGDGSDPGAFASSGTDYLDDVAKYLYDTDLLPDSGTDPRSPGKQNVITHTIGFGLTGADAQAVTLLTQTAYNGGGNYYLASSTSGLSESLRQILATIIQDNTSFVAPVVPVSPENRTFSGKRIYMGFFKPQPNGFWFGNIKKYGLSDTGAILDKNGAAATNADGSIRDNAVSYWSTAADGATVENGGTGALLQGRTTARGIYTYTGTSLNLTDPTNAFTTTNAAITFTTLGVADAIAKDNLINYIQGYDAYDDNSNGITTEKRDWVLGDILHSKPLIINYTTFTTSQEANCSVNKNVIYVGSNDGMLHAFNDCDGSELWAFIPQDLLASLQSIHGATHTYFVDSSPMAYIYDHNSNGVIETIDGDKVIIMFGERRGGGYYYALDVSDPANPKYMWRLSSSTSPSGTNTDYSELAESWSEPVITKVLTSTAGTDTTKVVAFIGAGYDNSAEDQQPAAASTVGRGIYAVEIARLDSAGVPGFTNSGYKLWGYTNVQNTSMTRSIPSQLSVADIDFNGFADRIYATDVGGNVWRFDIGSNLTSNWSARRIFQSNPGADASTGRKMFYRPSLTLEVGYEMLFFGTGDREHPTDTTTAVDRLYAVKDTGQTAPKTETDLTDATTSTSVNITGSSGWFIKLNVNTGEKDLAYATVVNKIAYYTTYTPSSSGVATCTSGNRGTARFYALEYLTAGPSYNFNTANDTGGVVTKDTTDRSNNIGTGIPSGMVTVINPGGFSAIIGSGGAIVTPAIKGTGSSIPTYWREVH